MNGEDRTLPQFLDALEHQVFPLILREPQRYIRPDLRGWVSDALPEVAKAIETLRELLREPDPEMVQRLAQVGLTGIQLQYKLHGFFGALEPALHAGRRPNRWLRQLFAWANVILGSLGSFLPLAEFIKEYKETLEIGVDYGP